MATIVIQGILLVVLCLSFSSMVRFLIVLCSLADIPCVPICAGPKILGTFNQSRFTQFLASKNARFFQYSPPFLSQFFRKTTITPATGWRGSTGQVTDRVTLEPRLTHRYLKTQTIPIFPIETWRYDRNSTMLHLLHIIRHWIWQVC